MGSSTIFLYEPRVETFYFEALDYVLLLDRRKTSSHATWYHISWKVWYVSVQKMDLPHTSSRILEEMKRLSTLFVEWNVEKVRRTRKKCQSDTWKYIEKFQIIREKTSRKVHSQLYIHGISVRLFINYIYTFNKRKATQPLVLDFIGLRMMVYKIQTCLSEPCFLLSLLRTCTYCYNTARSFFFLSRLYDAVKRKLEGKEKEQEVQ